ncbi:M10 family metallopeptidase C-terminal domain-containing protein [Qipengyuania xiapuensis]|uniref:M10 family metallopeptidase C-terminal domain-containing protein n=1 Tax=Qipengyuania xiapuensis TaxID=2867236 RepID=A0ABX8ZZ63_9SPHN|nr:M10 family metallopeptidase C-terminal domain-containing protein [Qipengyuania xiapuensis]QZD92887.1 M10 family metallopeptidase C-terminal domain-containing protein [Qipengyuania xiapuensis]
MFAANSTRALEIVEADNATMTVRSAYDLSRLDLATFDFNHQESCGCVCCGAQDAVKIANADIVNQSSGQSSANGVDIPGDTSTTATIGIGGSVTDELEVVGDTDWFRITLQAGDQIDISLFGSGATPVSDTYLRLYDENGVLVAENDDGGTGLNSFLRFLSENGGTYYIEADSYANNKTGEYTIEVTETQPIPVYTYDQIADQLTNGYWGGASRSFNVGADGQLTYDVSALPADAQYLAEQALALWSDITGIEFVSVTSGAEITFQDTDSGAYASSSRIGSTITSSTVNVGTDWLASYGTDLNSYSFQTYIHEIGHALGLGHAGNYNGGADYVTDALYENDAWSTTVMSYFSQIENSYFSTQGFTFAYVTTPMNGDVVAITNLYGFSSTTRTGDTTYGFNNNSGRDVYDATLNPDTAYTIYDSGGNDTLDYSGFTNDQLIDLRQEFFSNVGAEVGNVMIARGTVIENAIGGSGADRFFGNSSANQITGNGGNDRVFALGGNDIVDGGAGADLIFGGDGADQLSGGTENDAIYGGNGNDDIFGGANDDFLDGEAGNDTINGEDGADLLRGGAGDDILSGGIGADHLEGGNDNDTLNGDADNDRLFGGAGNDILNGGDGEDSLFGGNGADTLNGGALADLMYGLAGSDIASGGSGNDFVHGGTENDQVNGNDGNDQLFGGAGLDTLDGGNGADSIYGDGGDDTLIGGAGNDRIVAGADNDTIYGRLGADIINGGPGDDVFVFDTALGAGQVDQIYDFGNGDDTIWLDNSIFTSLSLGALDPSAFHLGTSAQDADDRIIFDSATGNLWYDEDGAGGAAAQLVAKLNLSAGLTAQDFLVVGNVPQTPLADPDKDALAMVENAIFV